MYPAYLKSNGIVNKCINLNIDRADIFLPFLSGRLGVIKRINRRNFSKILRPSKIIIHMIIRENESEFYFFKKIIQGRKDHEI